MNNLKAISLFSSGGIGDLALRDCGVDTIVANELIEERARVFEYNYPKCKMIVGDICELKDQIISSSIQRLNGEELDILFATPPCQGMSKNGRGKLLDGIRRGLKSKFDKRNQLIVPTLEIVKALKPQTVILENVPEMKNTIIESPNGGLVNIIDFISETLKGYTGKAEVVEFANYGVPQRRQRLITIFTKNKGLIDYYKIHNTFLPLITHTQDGFGGTAKWLTVKDVIAHTPKLDASTKEKAQCKKISTIEFHY